MRVCMQLLLDETFPYEFRRAPANTTTAPSAPSARASAAANAARAAAAAAAASAFPLSSAAARPSASSSDWRQAACSD